jgi:hypothetical protein
MYGPSDSPGDLSPGDRRSTSDAEHRISPGRRGSMSLIGALQRKKSQDNILDGVAGNDSEGQVSANISLASSDAYVGHDARSNTSSIYSKNTNCNGRDLEIR